jgi:hypothetical protein
MMPPAYTIEETNADGTTNLLNLKYLAKQYLTNCSFEPPEVKNPRAMVSTSGGTLDLAAARLELPEPKKAGGYWVTPSMTFLSKQHIPAGASNDAAGVVQMLHVICHNTDFVKQRAYRALPVEGGWVVEVVPAATNSARNVPALPPYELVLDDSQHITQIRERCYPFSGSPRVYGNTLRAVYEREMKLNGGGNFSSVIEKELAKAMELEKAQKAAKPAPAPKKD